MKRLLTIFLLLVYLSVQAQTTNPTPTRFTNGFLIPNSVAAPFVGSGSLWFQSGKLTVHNGSLWQAYLSETLASTTYTTLTRTITINGVTQDLSADRTFTTTDAQTLSLSTTVAGNLIISNGNNVTLRNISAATFTDRTILPTSTGVFPFVTSSATGFPTATGGGLWYNRTANSTTGAFIIYSSNGSGDDLYYTKGNPSGGFFTNHIILSEDKAATLYAPLASPTFTGITSAAQYKLSALNTAPASATATGTLGEIRIDANFIYICVASNSWKRVAISTW